MESIVLLIHIVVCILLVVVVLLQSGKSADLAGAFGGAGSQSSFGPRGSASFLSKMTTTLAILFMVTSLSLWIIGANKSSGESVITKDDAAQEAPAKAETPQAEEKKDAAAQTPPAPTKDVKTEQPAQQPAVTTPEGNAAKPEEKKEEQKTDSGVADKSGNTQG